jgi:hypothetical protein
MPKRIRRKHIPSVKIVSEKIDKKWKYDYETKTFSHPAYPNKTFKAICDNKTKEYTNEYKDKYGKTQFKKITENISTLYPNINPSEDNRNLGYNLVTTTTPYNFDIVSNKMTSFWDTKYGKKYMGYISYRKRRDSNKKTWLEMNPPEKKVKNQSKKK